MSKIKNVLLFFIIVIVLLFGYLYRDKIVDELKNVLKEFKGEPELVINPPNQFTKNYDFRFVSQESEYIPHTYVDIINIFYSTLNQGWTSFTFYCPSEYSHCLEDVNRVSNDQVLLSNINNFVSPFNSYSTIRTTYDDSGRVTINITHIYSDVEIKQLNSDIDEIMSKYIKDDMSIKVKIGTLHNYIINNTKYDVTRADTGDSKYDSARIQGVLYDHYAICSGYSDTMAVMLDKLGVKNYRISSSSHVWNALFLNNKWLHLDVTWDDPITTSGKDRLETTFFLKETEDMYSSDTDAHEHDFDRDIYLEFK